ncbi:thioesterase [Eubacteriales bacterium mix99]|jgi:acyl-ACP thioesterase
MPESLVFPSVFPETAERTVQYSETDLNGHMNNSCYLDWMDDLLDVAFHRCHIIRSLQINFVSEVQTGQTVTIHWLLEDRLLFVKGCFDGRQIFAVRAIFQ